MKKQVFILVGIVMFAIGFFFLSSIPRSNSGTLFEHDRFEEGDFSEETEVVALEGSTFVHSETVFIDVQGEVNNPGVFEVSGDVRVGYLIELAGGLTDEANVRGFNQAARVYDEMMIFVPHVDDENEVVNVAVVANGSSLISLSAASATELQTLPGIGPVTSANIVAHREANGAFASIDELVNVEGIGARTLENIRELVQP
ncbi:MAG: helix-hairpin-helix domain-containing protein [Turicibacter sp.]|nr:helix-hairpin-helix domain-containing protein [Turicibacter sp.]